MADALGKGELALDIFSIIFFHRCLIESAVIKPVFRDHLRIWSLMLCVMTGEGFQGDENVMSVFVLEVIRISLFCGIGILQCI